MLENELILLGLLKESPQHGYEIKRKIREIIPLFAGIDLKSVYYPLQVLEKKQLVVKRITKQGRRPQRYVYSLSPKGEARFQELLEKSFVQLKRPQFSLDLSLYFLHYLKAKTARRKLRSRLFILKRLSRSLKNTIKILKKKESSRLALILEHNLKLLEAESAFLHSLNKTFL